MGKQFEILDLNPVLHSSTLAESPIAASSKAKGASEPGN
jgi:hypothetical protein